MSKDPLDNIVHSSRVLRMNAVVMGIVLGVLTGGALFLMTIILVLKGGEVVGPHLQLIGQIFIGYKVTFLGSVIGFAYAFVAGFLIGFVGSKLYNWIADLREGERGIMSDPAHFDVPHPAATPIVSIVIPVRNDAKRLRQCLEALRASTYRDYETIVVDDASTDETPRVAQDLGANVLALDHNVGPAAARNRGAEIAKGKYLFFFDADVCVHPDTVGLVAETFERDASVAALFGSYDLQPGDKHFLSQYKNLFHHYVHQQGKENASTFWSGCGAIKRSVFLEMNGFDTSYSRPCIEDIELGARLIRAGHRIVLNKRIQATHLKRWTLMGILKTDVLDRGVPWTELILREKNLPNDLNLGFGQRVAALFACAFIALLVIGIFFHAAWFALPIPLIAIVALNHRFYAFFVKQRSLWFAIRVLPMHVLYYLYSGAALAMGILAHIWKQKLKPRPPAGEKTHLPEGSCPG